MPYHQSKNNYSSRRSFSPNRGNRGSRQPKKDYINPSRFIKSATPQAEISFTPVTNFAELDIHPLIKKNIEIMGFLSPSPVQDQAVPPALLGKDIVGIADTGTGKTAAFAIPLLNRLISEKNSRAIILAPTRELAQQIEEQCRQIARGSGLNGAVLIGGSSMGIQLRDLRDNPRIIIGTPGRIKDHLNRKTLKLSDCNIVVLDEVDRMLDMGFIHDIRAILEQASKDRQNYYFSATLDTRVRSIIEGFSSDPVYISIKSGEASDNVEQNVIEFNSQSDKLSKLQDLLTSDSTSKVLVFDDTHRSVEKLATELGGRGFAADSIHGGKSQSQRERVLKKFKTSQINVLVATDVAARGLDISDISHVVNYALPQTYDDYIHRIGRTGRAGRTGHALTFVEN